MLAAAAPYAGWLRTAASQSVGACAQAQAVAGAFESALAATVHPAAVAANRSDFLTLVLSNLFGQNAPAIAATESIYEEMWAQDVTAMVDYHAGAAAAVAQLISPAQALQSLPNFGYGNTGQGNIGFFNDGTLNVGIANLSPTSPPPTPSPPSAASAWPTPAPKTSAPTTAAPKTSAPGTTACSTSASPTPAPPTAAYP
ncbi:hypothetical protein NIIDMKKI_31990 [Mycobacterium kansasii]|uniref:PPE domain-containing protein n=1 Tax=Mycobacterium kansasii TaxID=1768 RepID=A0A7G1ICG8_MYCKA|nr:hypothetical protein NIIDMKKI_31990 [Mycobacterium kansasii]